MGNEILYKAKGLSYSYLGRFRALSGIDLEIRKGEKVALLGANGSGKSTLLLALAGLIFADEGNIKFLGRDLCEASFGDGAFQEFFRSRVGIVFQNSDVQLFNSTVEDELLFGLVQMAFSKEDINQRLRKYASLMGVTNLMERHPQNLSLGEKKRVAIASVLVMEPEVILLDEPTSGLDPRTCRHLVEAISVFSEKGATIITATQDIHIVPEIADRVIVLGEDKRKVRDGNTEEVLKDTAFLESHNLIHTHAHKHKDAIHIHPHEHPTHDHPHPA